MEYLLKARVTLLLSVLWNKGEIMITAEQVLLEYNILADAGASSKQIYEGMCAEIAMLRNALSEKQQPLAVSETLPEQEYKQ